MSDPSTQHQPVMLQECLEHLSLRPGSAVVDGTLGYGGHSVAMLAVIGREGRLLGLDQDPHALAAADARLAAYCEAQGWPPPYPYRLHRGNFETIAEAARAEGFASVQGVLLDLGVSSPQLDVAERGFSFRADGPLDMRMDPTAPETAADLVNTLPEAELADLIWEFGEERFSRRIARRIVEFRQREPFQTTRQLADTVRHSYPPAMRHGPIHPATRTFQALRIAVNRELDVLAQALAGAAEILAEGGRIVVLSYHSLEDRIVKRAFERLAGRCHCPRELPVCACGAQERMRIVTRKPLTPTPEEVDRNPRARSAKLRAAERISGS